MSRMNRLRLLVLAFAAAPYLLRLVLYTNNLSMNIEDADPVNWSSQVVNVTGLDGVYAPEDPEPEVKFIK